MPAQNRYVRPGSGILDVHPDAPAFAGGMGRFRVGRVPGIWHHDALAQLGNAVAPARVTVTYVSAKSLLMNVTNVEGEDRVDIGANFDWLSSFATQKLAFYPEPINQAQLATRDRMRSLLGSSQLAQNIFDKVLSPSKRDGRERAAAILADGQLGPLALGTFQEVTPKPAAGAVGVIHSHPGPPQFIAPPSHDYMDEDYDEESLRKEPIQFVIEISTGRLWGQYPHGRTSLIAGISEPRGQVKMISPDDPTYALVYKTENRDRWDADTPAVREKLRLRRLGKTK